MSRFHHRSKSSILLAGLILLTAIGVVNMGYDSDLSDDHPNPDAAFTPLIHFDDTYDAVTFIKFIGQAIILPSTEKQCFSSRAPPKEVKGTVFQDHQYSLPSLTFFIGAILISFQAIFVSFNQNYWGVLLWRNRKKPKYSMTYPQINRKENQISRLKLQESQCGEDVTARFLLLLRR